MRPSGSDGNFTLGEITTPTAQDSELASTASNPKRLVPFPVSSEPASRATPIMPKASPSALTRLSCC